LRPLKASGDIGRAGRRLNAAPHLALTAASSAGRRPGGVSEADRRYSAKVGAPSTPAANANRASAGRDLDPVFFMIEARWFSTVRWLMCRSAAIFLLGWPASNHHHHHHLALPLGQRIQVMGRFAPPRGQCLGVAGLFDRPVETPQQFDAPTGFSMKSEAPAFIALTAMVTLLLPVIMTDGNEWPSSRSLLISSNPDMPGR
jgi:hypothetical protein